MSASTPAPDHRPPPLLIFATHYRQACEWARDTLRGREGRDWRYVSSPHQVFGYHGPGRYVVLAIPGQRISLRALDDRDEALAFLRRRGFTPVNPRRPG